MNKKRNLYFSALAFFSACQVFQNKAPSSSSSSSSQRQTEVQGLATPNPMPAAVPEPVPNTLLPVAQSGQKPQAKPLPSLVSQANLSTGTQNSSIPASNVISNGSKPETKTDALASALKAFNENDFLAALKKLPSSI